MAPVIDKLDYQPPPPGARRPLLRSNDSPTSSNRHSQDTSYAGSFFDQVAEGIQRKERAKMTRELVRYSGFACAILNCLCAGSITAYSLYGHLFQSRLRYSQYQVNIVSVTAELAMYLPVPAFGYLCDRYGPGIPSLLSGFMFGVGYILAAFTYHNGWPFAVMVLAFIGIGMGTSCMYLSAVTTCAKNFGRGNHKGLALAMPIAAFGLSGMWQSQVGSRLLYERNPDGTRGDVDVFRFFLFLGITLLCVGCVGSVALRIVDEEEMIDEAVDELERSGLLAEADFFHRAAQQHGYGTMSHSDLSDSTYAFLQREAEDLKNRHLEEQRKKNWLLNAETRHFLSDPTMWWLAAGFFLVTGPGEAFINNLGTIIPTLAPPNSDSPTTSPATHVSIVAITSTLARLITGTLTDVLAPQAQPGQHRRDPTSLSNSLASLPDEAPLESSHQQRRLTISRIPFLLTFSLLLSLGQALLASGAIQNHADRFWIVSSFIGAGYGAVFSLVPIVVSVVWGVENFGTNWGIVAMVPAVGAAVWGVVYAGVYSRGAQDGGVAEELCYGKSCYASTFWAMAASVWMACGLWIWAWRGKGGWISRGVAV